MFYINKMNTSHNFKFPTICQILQSTSKKLIDLRDFIKDILTTHNTRRQTDNFLKNNSLSFVSRNCSHDSLSWQWTIGNIPSNLELIPGLQHKHNLLRKEYTNESE